MTLQTISYISNAVMLLLELHQFFWTDDGHGDGPALPLQATPPQSYKNRPGRVEVAQEQI